MNEFEQSFRTRLINHLDAGKEWESRGMGMPGLVEDHCNLEHDSRAIKLETDSVYDEIVAADDDAFTDEESFFEWITDWEIREEVYTADIEDAVHLAGIGKCFDYLAEVTGSSEANATGDLYFAVYVDLQRSLVTAFCEVAREVEDEMEG